MPVKNNLFIKLVVKFYSNKEILRNKINQFWTYNFF